MSDLLSVELLQYLNMLSSAASLPSDYLLHKLELIFPSFSVLRFSYLVAPNFTFFLTLSSLIYSSSILSTHGVPLGVVTIMGSWHFSD